MQLLGKQRFVGLSLDPRVVDLRMLDPEDEALVLMYVLKVQPFALQIKGVGMGARAERVAYGALWWYFRGRRDADLLNGCDTYVEAGVRSGLFGEEDVRPGLGVQCCHHMVHNTVYPASVVAGVLEALRSKWPLVDPVAVLEQVRDGPQGEMVLGRVAEITGELEAAKQRRALDTGQAEEARTQHEAERILGMFPTGAELSRARQDIDNFFRLADAEQRSAIEWFMRALARLGEGDNGRHLFLIGSAGTGKSLVLAAILALCVLFGIKVLRTASTGHGAVPSGARTFHSAFGIVEGEGGPVSRLKVSSPDGRAVALAQVLIVEEFSMLQLRALQLAQRLCQRMAGQLEDGVYVECLQNWRGLWAGKIVILVGDPHQLPAVVPGATPMEEAAAQVRLGGFPGVPDVIELTTIHRQRDPQYQRLAGWCRDYAGGPLPPEVAAALNGCIVPGGDEEQKALAVDCVARDEESRIAVTTHDDQEHLIGRRECLFDGVSEDVCSRFISGQIFPQFTTLRGELGYFSIKCVTGVPSTRRDVNYFASHAKAAGSKTVPDKVRIWRGRLLLIQQNVSVQAGVANGSLCRAVEVIRVDGDPVALIVDMNVSGLGPPRLFALR
jgi:hypothetical protein